MEFLQLNRIHGALRNSQGRDDARMKKLSFELTECNKQVEAEE